MKKLILLAVAMALPSCGAGAEEAGRDLFHSEAQALAFGRLLGPLFATASGKTEHAEADGHRRVRHVFEASDKIAALDLVYNPEGEIRQVEINFPVVDGKCSRAPPSRELARLAIENTEPYLANSVRNINLVGSLADLGWPRQSSSSPAAKLGNTIYSFHRLRYFCTMTIDRRPVATRTV